MKNSSILIQLNVKKIPFNVKNIIIEVIII